MNETRNVLLDKMLGCLLGSAVGDAMGGPVEGLGRDEIAHAYGTVEGMLPYPASSSPSFHGPFDARAGATTDDTRLAKLITRALISSGGRPRRGDLGRALASAYYSATSTLERGFLEEYALAALYGQDKEAFGGRVTNGAIMAIAPIGVLFPGDPGRTFDAAFDLLFMATGSARVSAAAAAAIISSALAEKGRAIDAAYRGLAAAAERSHRVEGNYWRGDRLYPEVGAWSLGLARRAVELAAKFADPMSEDFRKALEQETRQPFFADGDETLAVALAMFVAADGDFRAALRGAVNYGKDCDSYAAVAGAFAGARQGLREIPEDWLAAVESCDAPPRLRHLAEGLCSSIAARMRIERAAASLGCLASFPEPPTPGIAAAAREGDAEKVGRLLSQGADPGDRGELGRTGLHLACASGRIDIVRTLLLAGANINEKDDNKTTALHFAAWENHIDIVELLLDWGIFGEEQEGKGWTALHDAVRKEYVDICLLILSRTRGFVMNADRVEALRKSTGDDRFLGLLGILDECGVSLGSIGICTHGLLHDAKKRGYARSIEFLLGKGVPDEA
jgi:ADP-ribosylglycohydrolase